ncbi:MAG: hypothetical protein D6715_10095 [Calditrichaeota bacterium]|nr:MAG: hypothetical protein D6715_10095 [Calditrichota bacterium]
MALLTLTVLCSGIGAQSPEAGQEENWAAFRARAEKFYTHINRGDLKNFSFFFSSSTFVNFVRQLGDTTDYYPLKFVWTREGNYYFILRPVPSVVDTSTYRDYMMRANELKQLFRGLLLDWEKFFVNSPFEDIPGDVRVHWGKDTVTASFWFEQGDKRLFMKRTFFRNGLLARDLWQDGPARVINYPIYREVNGRWVCYGWDTQVQQGDSIVSGLAVRADVQKIGDRWLPLRLDVTAQSSKYPGRRSTTSIFLKNFLFNEDIEVVKTPPSNPSGQP